jgi:hypothetical protein
VLSTQEKLRRAEEALKVGPGCEQMLRTAVMGCQNIEAGDRIIAGFRFVRTTL